MSESLKRTDLTGIVEADETYLAESHKGDKKRFAEEGAERKPSKRGGEVHKRGLSNELVCIPCAINRKVNAVSKVAKLGKCSTEVVSQVLDGYVNAAATLCTDDDASYRRFSKENGNELVQIKVGKDSVKGNISHPASQRKPLKTQTVSVRI